MITLLTLAPLDNLNIGFWFSPCLSLPKAEPATNRLFFMSWLLPLYSFVAVTVTVLLDAVGQLGNWDMATDDRLNLISNLLLDKLGNED
jgi:hypothetical protein